jgi:prepilin-type N-terminal cleavage/methylation domain-containing protein
MLFAVSRQTLHKLAASEECMIERVLQRSRGGFTLLEIVVAVGIFALALGAVAQGVAYSYGLTLLQNQRVVAANDCRAVISGLRQTISANNDTTGCPKNANKFPCLIMEYVTNFPANAAAVAALSTAARVPFAGMYSLKNETITISLKAADGSAAVNGTGASNSTNPVYVTVTAQWTGPRGITYREVIRTLMTSG